jgi:uncharacterized protein with PQ loop repeat
LDLIIFAASHVGSLRPATFCSLSVYAEFLVAPQRGNGRQDSAILLMIFWVGIMVVATTKFKVNYQLVHVFRCGNNQMSTTNLFMFSFLSRTIDFFLFYLLSLWIYLWLAETSQQPISQTTWLKVTPHCNHWAGIMVVANNQIA